MGNTTAIGGEAEHGERQRQDREHGELHLARLDLLADVFGRAADHQPGDEDRDEHEDQHAVEAGADAADDDLAELHVDERDQPAERHEAVVHRVHRAAGGGGGDDGEERRERRAEADLLALHVGAVDPERVDQRVAVRLGPVGDADAGDEEDAHRGEDRPALALVADHAAEDVGERGAEREDRDHLQEVRDRGRVLERMRGVDVEEAAAVGAEHLDRDLRGDRAGGDGLAGAFEGGRLDRAGERLRHAEEDQDERENDADGQQHEEGDPGQVHPEVADASAPRPERSRG